MKSVTQFSRLVVLGLPILFLCCNKATAHSDAGSHSDPEISILKGQAVEMDLREICRNALEQCDEQTLSILKEPAEGIIFKKKGKDVIRYQHAGTSDIDDSFVFSAASEGQSESVLVSILVTTDAPVLTIISPMSNNSIASGDIEIVFSVQGQGFDHIHVALQEGEHVSVDPEKARHVFEDVQPGTYTLTAVLASESHSEIPDTAVTQTIVVAD